jgi:hypothetical protein
MNVLVHEAGEDGDLETTQVPLPLTLAFQIGSMSNQQIGYMR